MQGTFEISASVSLKETLKRVLATEKRDQWDFFQFFLQQNKCWEPTQFKSFLYRSEWPQQMHKQDTRIA